jgi:hypothetical protein
MIDLDKVSITRVGGEVLIVHFPTGTSIKVPMSQLERWCLSQVRKAVQ